MDKQELISRVPQPLGESWGLPFGEEHDKWNVAVSGLLPSPKSPPPKKKKKQKKKNKQTNKTNKQNKQTRPPKKTTTKKHTKNKKNQLILYHACLVTDGAPAKILTDLLCTENFINV